MSRLLSGVVLIEGISHIEDLSIDEFIRTVETLSDRVVTEKLDGANLWFGLDEHGLFTSREAKSKRSNRFYSVKDYPMVAAHNGFRATHLALQQVEEQIKKVLSVGDIIEIEVLFGRQPNTVTYGAEGKNYIVFLRGISTDDAKVKQLADVLDNKSVTVTSAVISSPDGDNLSKTDSAITWQFVQVKPIDSTKIKSVEADEKIKELKKYLSSKNDNYESKTNKEIAEIKLGTVGKDDREAMKAERERVLSVIMSEYKVPIKDIFLNNFVRKVKPKLQDKDLQPDEDVGVEGIVIRDPETGDQAKIVDKDVFTAINKFNNEIRNNVAGLVRTDDQDAPIELRGGAFGQAKIRIADLLGIRDLALSSGTKRILTKFKGDSPEDTARNLANSINLESLPSVRTKISAILKNAVLEINEIVDAFKNNSGNYKLKLNTGKEIGISPEVMRRNLTAFAETKRDIANINHSVLKSREVSDLVLALYGKTIQSIHGTKNTMSESKTQSSFSSLIKSISEEGDAVGAGTAAYGEVPMMANSTTSSAISTNPVKMLKGNKVITRMKRAFKKKSKFTNESSSLVRIVEELADAKNEFATDVDDKAAAKSDVEFKQLRNNITMGAKVSDTDVNKYLDKAHELNDEVDTVTFGMELDTGEIVKIYVNVAQADEFEKALSDMLGQFDDVQEVIDQLADTFDIVDVEWPKKDETPADSTEFPHDDEAQSQSDEVQAAIDEVPADEPDIDTTFFHDGEPESGEQTDDEQSTDSTDANDEAKDNDKSEFFADDESSKDNDKSEFFADDNSSNDDEEQDSVDDSVQDENNSDEDEDIDQEDTVDDDDGSTDEQDSEKNSDSEKKPPKKPKKKEESAMTFGQKFKDKLLEKAKEPKVSDKSKKAEDDQELEDVHQFPSQLQKLLTAFPTTGEKSMIALMWALGAPLDALVLRKAELRKTVGNAGDMHMKDSQFRLWTKRLIDQLMTDTASSMKTESKLEDELSNTYQKMILGVLQKIGLPESVEKIARNALRNNVRDKAALIMKDIKGRQYLKMVAEILGVDSVSGMVKEAKNHMGETEYSTFDSWKRACKKVCASCWIDGDKDIAQAMAGAKPFAKKQTVAIGEWDGATGSVFANADSLVRSLTEAVEIPADEQTGNEWVDEIMALAVALGIPQTNLDYRKAQLVQELRKRRVSIKNVALVLRNVKRLNAIISGNEK